MLTYITMHLSTGILSAALAVVASAEVAFYGTQGDSGDYVTCASDDISDAKLIETLGEPYQNELEDGKTYFQDLGANATCISANDDDDGMKRRVASPSKLDARADDRVTCSKYTGQCRDQYQSATNSCDDGYTKQLFSLDGHLPDTWCVRDCEAVDRKSCRGEQCNYSTELCNRPGSALKHCSEALSECRGQPVAMPEDRFTGKILHDNFAFFGSYCKSRRLTCVSYKDGACSVNEDLIREYKEHARKQNYGNSFASFGKPRQ
ncbi:hypothetical protein NLG97_g6706 [Lecanicillium saksenae]|uniref:Uncharacterized protein n=1 Tax=Lecanicillium saksenae TaxID=468837 RepID=A0ACC1QP09_9HYPO|nr:hypothetical protein NLG97_g6706 [Lecanicillium saksenae]